MQTEFFYQKSDNKRILLFLLFICYLIPARQCDAVISDIAVADTGGIARSAFATGDEVLYRITYDITSPALVALNVTVLFQGALNQSFKPRISVLNDDTTFCLSGNIPDSATGEAVVLVSSLSIPGKVEIRRECFTVFSDQDAVRDNPFYICSACHNETFQGWLTSEHSPRVSCTYCHGLPERHIHDPGADTIERPDSDICHRCHSQNNGARIAAENGFIAPRQQYDELENSPHAETADCLTCHNPHFSPFFDKKSAIHTACSACHPQKKVYLTMQDLACEACHMAPAVAHATDTRDGNDLYRSGYAASHIIRIKTDAVPSEMFSPDGTAVRLDGSGAYLTLDRSCMYCHNGADASRKTFMYMQQSSTLVH